MFIEPLTVTSVEEESENIPKEFALQQNYPNPFNSETTISYTIPNIETRRSESLQHVKLRVYDVLGREVITLVNKVQWQGTYKVEFSTKFLNTELSSGVYFYRLTAGNFLQTKKMIVTK